MKYFKYALFALTALFSIQSYAVCHHPATYQGIADKPFPNTVCYPEGGTGNGFCKFDLVPPPFDVQLPCTDFDGCVSTSYAVDLKSVNDRVYTNSNCTSQLQDGCLQLPNGNIECEEEPEEENDPVLQCSTDSCPNPYNKRCPVGYTRGSFNGQNLCVKTTTDDDEPECIDPNGCEESNDEIIEAIDRANNDITNSTNSLGQMLSNSLNSVKNALGEIADKLENLADSITSSNNGSGENTSQPPDTSQFNADLPVQDVEINQNIDTRLFSSNNQCPAKKIINIPQYGLHYEFDFSEICNTLQMFGYLVLVFAYVIAARIVIKA